LASGLAGSAAAAAGRAATEIPTDPSVDPCCDAAVAAAVAAVLAKTAFSTQAIASQAHWMDNAVNSPIYNNGESLFENPLYDPPVESV